MNSELQQPRPEETGERADFGQVPPEITEILNKNYDMPELSDSEPEENELTLETLRPYQVLEIQPNQYLEEPELNATIEDFMKNILAQLNLVKTLNMFQSEFLELQEQDVPQLNQMNTPQSALLLENVNLRFKNDQLQLQNDKIVQAAEKAKEYFSKLRAQRDFHKTKHRQAAYEKLVLLNDLRRLREHCYLYQPLIVELNTRYDKLLRQKQLSDIQRDKAQNDLKKLQAQISPEREPEISYMKRISKREVIYKPQEPKQLVREHFKPQRELDQTNAYLSAQDRVVNYDTKEAQTAQSAQGKSKQIVQLTASATVQHAAAVSSVQIHQNRPVILSASADGSFRVCYQEYMQLLLQASPHSSYVSCARFSPSPQYQSILASCSGDGTVKLFNILNQQEICSFEKIHASANWLDWHCYGSVLAVAGSDRACRLFDVNVGQVIAQLDLGTAVQEIEPFLALRQSQRLVDFCHFQPCGNLIAVGGADKHCRVFDPRVGNNMIHDYTLQNACKGGFDAAGSLLCMCDCDGNVLVQDIRAQKPFFKGKIADQLNCCTVGFQTSWYGGKQGIYQLINNELKPVDKTQAYCVESIHCSVSAGQVVFGCADGAIGVLCG